MAGSGHARHGDGEGIAVDVGGRGDAEPAVAGVLSDDDGLVGVGHRQVVHRVTLRVDGLAVGAAVAVVDAVAE